MQDKEALFEKVSDEPQQCITEHHKKLQLVTEQTAKKALGCTDEGSFGIVQKNILKNKSQEKRNQQEVGISNSVICQTNRNSTQQDTFKKAESEVTRIIEDAKPSDGIRVVALWDYQAGMLAFYFRFFGKY